MTTEGCIKVLFYNESSAFKDGFSFLLKNTSNLILLESSGRVELAQNEIIIYLPDIIFLEVSSVDSNMPELIRFAKTFPEKDIKVLIYTSIDDEEFVQKVMKYGVDGYILKNTSPADVVKSLFEIQDGGSVISPKIIKRIVDNFYSSEKNFDRSLQTLTNREKEIVSWLLKGYPYKLIAAKTGIKLDTVRSHIRKIYDKMDVNSRSEIMLKSFNYKVI
jgi:DNA-binding NarL/FixJ family response regulator